MSERYRNSERLYEQARRLIPLGSQTFSKSVTQLPLGVSPLFASHAQGARLHDVDGNEYVDFINGLGCVLLGYREPGVERAVLEQLERGVTFSLSHELEMRVAERIVRLVPSAEQVRFGKNGTDATSAAVRLARAHTGRDHVALCGYHGWQDWSIGVTSRNRGVPAAVQALSHSFAWGDCGALESVLESVPGGFAAVIMEPMNVREPPPGYLESIRELAHAHGALLIFDETVTGFRLHRGGAQALFGVTPDLTTLGKGLGNGFPISAVTGRAELMAGFEEVFFSGTFGGETLSLAAADATLERIEGDDVPGRLAMLGARLKAGLEALIEAERLDGVFAVSGHPSWSFLTIATEAGADTASIRTLLLQELFAAGVLFLGSHNVSAAHSDEDIDFLLAAYGRILPRIAAAMRSGTVQDLLRVPPIEPVFRVRG